MDRRPALFQRRLKNALASPSLATALERALGSFRGRREAAFLDMDFEAIRNELIGRKNAAIEHLPELIRRFQDEAEKVGAVVHHAATAAGAREVVGALLRERGVKLAVKSKSMVTEEVGLNAYLESQGVCVVETDLGEWIVQIAGEHPSHLIAPAIHKTREEVAELFRRKLGVAVPADVSELVKVARAHLRQSFIDADAGISGANIAIAESGTLVVVSNEGNARLVTTMPPVHVAIVGIEKIVPQLDDATAILKVLARSAVGQKLSSYVSFITGPSRSADIELDLAIGVHGPREVHIVLLDNGRSALREDDERSALLRCIRCAACANVCPSYQVVGGHAFGHVYTGPIGLLLTEAHHGIEMAAGPQSLCASCNACEGVCPVGIPLTRLILELRQRVVARQGLSVAKRVLLAGVAQPALNRWAHVARVVQRPFARNGILRVPLLEGTRTSPPIPALAPVSLADRLNRLAGEASSGPASRRLHLDNELAGSAVGYFAGCITDHILPSTGEAIVKILLALGIKVEYLANRSCCGLSAINSGDNVSAVRMAKQTIEAFEQVDGGYIVSGSTSCVATIRLDYVRLLANDPHWQQRARIQAERIIDFASFVTRAKPSFGVPLAGQSALQVTYHDSCQSLNRLGLRDQLRVLIRGALGVDIVEMADSASCCGFGGSFSFQQPVLSRRISARKTRCIEATGLSMVVTDNPGCVMHLRGALGAARSSIRVVHVAELMAEHLGD